MRKRTPSQNALLGLVFPVSRERETMTELQVEMSFEEGAGGVRFDHFEADMNPFKAHNADDDEAASVASSTEEDHPLPIADEHGNLVHYPGEDKDIHHHKVC